MDRSWNVVYRNFIVPSHSAHLFQPFRHHGYQNIPPQEKKKKKKKRKGRSCSRGAGAASRLFFKLRISSTTYISMPPVRSRVFLYRAHISAQCAWYADRSPAVHLRKSATVNKLFIRHQTSSSAVYNEVVVPRALLLELDVSVTMVFSSGMSLYLGKHRFLFLSLSFIESSFLSTLYMLSVPSRRHDLNG